MYLVQECVTKSAPRRSGDYNTGLLNVLSTTVIILFSLASEQICLISQILSVGLVGVSIQMHRVLGLIDS